MATLDTFIRTQAAPKSFVPSCYSGEAATCFVIAPPILNATFEPFDLLVKRMESQDLILPDPVQGDHGLLIVLIETNSMLGRWAASQIAAI